MKALLALEWEKSLAAICPTTQEIFKGRTVDPVGAQGSESSEIGHVGGG